MKEKSFLRLSIKAFLHPKKALKWLLRKLRIQSPGPGHLDSKSRIIRTASLIKRKPISFPETKEELLQAPLYKDQFWYYHAELLPGVITKGVYPENYPMLPRILMRNCDLKNTSCMDIGSMEGIIPVLMKRQGAREVVATDAYDDSGYRMEALKHYYNVNFDFYVVGLMYDLYKKFPGKSFDLINCSGLLYHVISPFHVLMGLRPLLKKNGLMIVSTNVVDVDGYFMEFNDRGRLQEEQDTFWYISIKLLDYMLRYLGLAPMDCMYVPHTIIQSDYKYVFDKPSGYLSVACKAVDHALPCDEDTWMPRSEKGSIERSGLCDWSRVGRQEKSKITYTSKTDKLFWRDDADCIDLWKAVKNSKPITEAKNPEDTHLLRLSDMS